MTTKKQTEKEKNEIKQIKEILTEYFSKDLVYWDKKIEMFSFPIGDIIRESKVWLFSIDHSFLLRYGEDVETEEFAFDVMMLQCLTRDLTLLLKKKIDFTMGHYVVFNDTDVCVGCIFPEDIVKYSEENELSYAIAKNVLSSKLIVEHEEEQKQNLNKITNGE